MSLLSSVIVVNAIIFTYFGILRKDPISTGMLAIFFQKNPNHLCLLLKDFGGPINCIPIVMMMG